jgi:hypothetical protein
LIIKLEDINPGNRGVLFIGGRGRVASATGVRLLDSERLVVCSLAGQRLYLMRYDVARGAHQIIDSIPTTYQGEAVCSDLIDYDGSGLLVVSNCKHNSATLYRIENDQLGYVKDIPIRDGSSAFCHGARFVPEAPGIVCLTCVRGDRNVYFISTSTAEIVYQFGHEQWRPHDVSFLDARRMVVVYERGKPTKRSSERYGAKAVLISFDLVNRVHELHGEIEFPEAHMDCCQVCGDRLYITNQMRDTVVVCRLAGDRIAFEREIPGFSFPHGLDLLPASDLLAVTNYGNNTVMLTELRTPASRPPS